MNRLIEEANELLKNAPFDWSICGGYAIDMFCGEQTRAHDDIDVCVFWENRDAVITYMKDIGWTVYAACGQGIVRLMTDLSQANHIRHNVFCVKDSNRSVHVAHIEDNAFKIEIEHREQLALDFIEFLFNSRNDGFFLYRRNDRVRREMGKATSFYQGIPFLAPEIALLYKSRPISDKHEYDFTTATTRMDGESRDWLLNSLDLCYPEGHPWSDRLKNLCR